MEGKHNFTSFARSQGELRGILKVSQKSFVQGRKRYWKQDGVYNSKPRTVEELTKTVLSIQVEEPSPPISASVYPPYSQVQWNVLFRSNLSNYSQRIYIYWNLIQIKFLDVIVEGESFLHNQVLSTPWKNIWYFAWYFLTNLFRSFSDPKNGRSCRGDCTGQGGPGSLGQVSKLAETDVVLCMLCCVVSDRFLRWLRQMPCCVVSAFVAHLSLSLGC